MFIFMYGVRVMRSVLEEKSTRVVEIIISSVKPLDLMMGKILGVTGVALVQFFAWIMMAVGLFQFLDTSENNMLLNYGEAIQNIFLSHLKLAIEKDDEDIADFKKEYTEKYL